MLNQEKIESRQQLRMEETKSVIPLFKFKDKLLTVSSDSCYTITRDGTNILKTKDVDAAIEAYNGEKINTGVKRTIVKSENELRQKLSQGKFQKINS